jgi:lysylphosphatidylglycerol synthetase-like protein (DUF2156 family)
LCKKIKQMIIKIIGALFLLLGVIKLIQSAENIWWFSIIMTAPVEYPSYLEYISYIAISMLSIGWPIAVIIAGYGTFKNKTWAWRWAIWACLVMFIINMYGVINFAVLCYYWRDMPIPPISEGDYVGYFSMWPTYIYAAAGAILILILSLKAVRREFNNLKTEA